MQFAKIVRVRAGFLLEPAAHLNPLAKHCVRQAVIFPVLQIERRGAGVGRARCLGHAADGTLYRAGQGVIVIITTTDLLAAQQTSHSSDHPALVLW
jgi:hypothetical protein